MLESSGKLPVGMIDNKNYHAEGLFENCLAIHSTPDRFRGKYCTLFFKTAPVDPLDIIYNEDDSTEIGKRGISASAVAIQRLLSRVLRSSYEDSTAFRVKPKLVNKDPQAMNFNYPSLSLCIPSSCSAADLGESIATIIGQYAVANSSIVTISDGNFCFSGDDKLPLDRPARAALYII